MTIRERFTSVAILAVFASAVFCASPAAAEETAACCAKDAHASEAKAEKPVACTISDPAKLSERKVESKALFEAAKTVVEVEDGYRLQFDSEMAKKVFDYVEFERECCAFLTFVMTFDEGAGSLWLGLHGSEDAKAFLTTNLSAYGLQATD